MARKRRPNADDVPTDSFSDIAFQLIIFFIVTTTVAGTAGFMSELPSSEKSTQQTEATDKTPSVNIKDNTVFFGIDSTTPVSLPQLHEKLAELKLSEVKDEAKKIVMMETSGTVDYQTYYEVMAAITKAGGRIGIVGEVE